MNQSPLNTIPLNGGASAPPCTGGGALNESALGSGALNGGECAASTTPALEGTARSKIKLRAVGLGSPAVYLHLSTVYLGAARVGLTTTTSARTGFAAFLPTLRTTASGQVGASLRLSAGLVIATGQARAGLHLRRVAVGTASTASPAGGLAFSTTRPISVTPQPPGAAVPGSVGTYSYTMRVRVTVGNTTLPATGSIDIEASENGARTASLTVQGQTGVTPGELLIITLSVTGSNTRLYRGTVDTVTYLPDDDETRISCTDQLQQYVDKLSNDQIDAITPGALTSPGNTDTGFAYLNHRLQSMTASVFLAQDGSFTVQSWVPDAQANTVDRTIDGTTTHTLRTLTRAGGTSQQAKRTEYLIKINFSWVRIAEAEVSAVWQDRFDICTWLKSGSVSLPNPQAIIDAVKNTGWEVKRLDISTVQPQSGWASCGAGSSFGVIIQGDGELAESAGWTLTKRYTRAMRATMAIRVVPRTSAPDAPVEVIERQINIKDPRDGKDWLDFGTGTLTAQDNNGDRYADLIDFGDTTGGVGTALDEARQSIINARAQLAYTIASAAVKIAQERRGERLQTSTPIRPDLDIGQTCQIAHSKITRVGVVTTIHHRIDIDAGSGTTTVEIAPYTPPDQGTIPASAANYSQNQTININPSAQPGQSMVDLSIVNLINRSQPMSNGSSTGHTVINAVLTRKQPTPAEDVTTPQALPRTYRGGTWDMPLPESDLWQGYMYNTPQTAITTGTQQPRFYPTYQNTGFFVRVPPINLPDQAEPLDLGETLTII